VLAPWGHADIIDINHKTLAIDGGIGGFGFCVSARDAGQTDELIRRLDVVGPHLCRAFDASLLIGGGQTGAQRHLSIALDLMPNAALLLDAQGRITQANAAAEELLRQSDGVAFDGKGGLQLSSALAGERRALASALKQALDVADGGFGTALSDPVRVTRLLGRSTAAGARGAVAAAVVPVPGVGRVGTGAGGDPRSIGQIASHRRIDAGGLWPNTGRSARCAAVGQRRQRTANAGAARRDLRYGQNAFAALLRKNWRAFAGTIDAPVDDVSDRVGVRSARAVNTNV
jgi:PAS domain-containing protein